MSTGFWEGLGNIPMLAGVLREWKQQWGSHFGMARAFLTPSSNVSESYPCVNSLGCECDHRVVQRASGRLVAVCQCDPPDCPPILLTPRDVLVYELDLPKLTEAVARALNLGKFDEADSLLAAPKAHPVGIYRPTQSPVFLLIQPEAIDFLAEAEVLAAVRTEPFVLLAPTLRDKTGPLENLLRRQRCAFIALADALELDGTGFKVTRPVEPLLEAFARGALGKPEGPQKRGRKPNRKAPQNSLTRGMRVWKLTFGGRETTLPDGNGIRYVEYLLKHPRREPIHGVELKSKVLGDVIIQEASLRQEDIDAQLALEEEAEHARAVLQDEEASEIEQDAAHETLDRIDQARRALGRKPGSNAEKAVDAVRKAIKRFYDGLLREKGKDGRPDPVLAAFAAHLKKHLLIPSARYSRDRFSRVRAGVAGTFTYEPPSGVVWEG